MKRTARSGAKADAILAPDQVLRLIILTKQEVISMMRNRFTLDEGRLNTALNAVPNTQPLTDGTYHTVIFGRVMHGHGVLKGGEIARATLDLVACCAYGPQVIEELSAEDPEGMLVLSARE